MQESFDTNAHKQDATARKWNNTHHGQTVPMEQSESSREQLTEQCSRHNHPQNGFWDYCIQLQAKIQSNTAHNIPTLGSQVPKTIMWEANYQYI
jgi:hypothetical protein